MEESKNILPPITSFDAVYNINRKRKKPERDFIDEMLGTEDPMKEYKAKRGKTKESSTDEVKIDTSHINKENKPMSGNDSGIYRKTGGLVIKVSPYLPYLLSIFISIDP